MPLFQIHAGVHPHTLCSCGLKYSKYTSQRTWNITYTYEMILCKAYFLRMNCIALCTKISINCLFTSKSWSSISPLTGKCGRNSASVMGILLSVLSALFAPLFSFCFGLVSRWELRDFSRMKLASGDRA